MTPRQLRAACRVRMARVYEALQVLAADGIVVQNGAGYRLG
jgi:sugar-specific transcriptional regulator TrmB